MLDTSEDGKLIFWDDVSGKMLKTEKVILARREEIDEFRKHLTTFTKEKVIGL